MIKPIARLSSDLTNRVFKHSAIPVVYYSAIRNVGDLLNPYMIPKMAGRPVYRARSTALPHVRAIGSVIGSAGPRSYIWGSGSIDGKLPRKAIDPAQVFALRGKLTHKLLSEAFGVCHSVPLGDPAILMPDFYDPHVPVQHEIGLVPHFADLSTVRHMAGTFKNVKIIDVRQQPESFIRELKSCGRVVSSSLHGLILADSYGIPNRWASFSSSLLGGTFKFDDYYSTTSAASRTPVIINNNEALEQLIRELRDIAAVNASTCVKVSLYSAFRTMCVAINRRTRALTGGED